MGIMLDSQPVIAAERMKLPANKLIEAVRIRYGAQPLGISSVSYAEIVHGTYRGSDAAIRVQRSQFLSDLLLTIPIFDLTKERATIAGRIDAEQRAIGIKIPFADLLIGATALSLNFSILTANERHFRMLPGLNVITL